jgi:ribose transport system substrate-binding protein
MLTLLAVTAGCPTPVDPNANGNGNGKDSEVKLAFVTNGIASFWNVAAAGVKAGEKEFGVDCEVLMPPEGAADQKRMVEDLLAKGIDGIAISPIDPANQSALIDAACEATNVITQDSDAPDTKRLCYVGMDNYTAGRMAGQLVKEAMPEGGSVMIFVGRLEQENAKLRRQGTIDELMDRTPDRDRFDPPGEEIVGDKYTILDTRTDQFDFGKAKSLAEDALAKYPKLGCMVGLFAYNPPKCLAAVKEAGRLDDVKIVGFDEEGETLQAIIDGEIYGTVVQNPFEYGRRSVEVLTALANDDKSVIPENGFIDIPARQIRSDNVKEFWEDLKGKIKAAESTDEPEANAKAAADEKVKVAFVTNNVSDFWKIAGAGIAKAEAEFNAECELLMPSDGTPENQQRLVENVIARGVTGMAISPNDAANQVEMLNKAAATINVITHDSDAPDSDRLCYVGTNNFVAGQEAGKLIKEVLPEGGKIMLFVGRMDAQNAIDRSNGIKDALKGSNVEIVDIRTDLADRARAKQNVEDTIASQPDIKCLVGLWSYNGPAILSAVKDAGKEGEMPIVCFDEEDATLQGILDGHIKATVVQQPYEFGYQSVRVLAALARGDKSVIPEGKIVDIPVVVVKPENVKEFWADLKAKVAG